MSLLYSRANGDWTTSTPWRLVHAATHLNAETATHTVTTAYSGTRTPAITPGAITIEGIAIKVSVRSGVTGTFDIHLALTATHVEVSGTLVSCNMSDFPVSATADLNGGWCFFKFASPVTLTAATNYEIECKTSTGSMLGLWRDGTSLNIDRCLVTSTAQAPVAGDDVIVGGEFVSAGTVNTITVTMNETASTDYGAASTSLLTPAVAVCKAGIVRYGVAASTAYTLKVSGHLIVYSGGEFSLGTASVKIPRGTTAELVIDCATNVEFGITPRNAGTFLAQALSRTVSIDEWMCFLTSDAAANALTANVDRATGWLDNDEIVIATTTRTAGQSELGALNGNAASGALTWDGFAGASGGVLNPHSGTSPTQAEVINLTRSILIRGASASLQTYIDIKPLAAIGWSWAAFKWMGSATALKRGIDVATASTGSFTALYCVFRDFAVSGSIALNFTGTTTIGPMARYCSLYNIYTNFFAVVSGTGLWTFDESVCIKTTDAAAFACAVGDSGGSSFGVTVVSAAGTAIRWTDAGSSTPAGTWGPFNLHGNGDIGFLVNCGVLQATPIVPINGIKAWRNTGEGISVGSNVVRNLTFSNFELFGNGTSNLDLSVSIGLLVLDTGTMAGDSTFGTGAGIRIQTSVVAKVKVRSVTFGVASGIKVNHTGADVIFTSTCCPDMEFDNCVLASSEVQGFPTLVHDGAILTFQKHDQTAGLHKTRVRNGNLTIETGITHSGGHSIAMALSTGAVSKLESAGRNGGFKVPVGNGQTRSVSCYVYEDATYAGARARLILKRNDALGVLADTVLDTATAASDLAWEELTGTTPAATDDGTFEFVVDCDGTLGAVYVDSFSAG